MTEIFKLTGAGNNFLLLDLRDQSRRSEKIIYSHRKTLAKKWCNTHFSVGADGLVFLDSTRDGQLVWDFYNADGSRAEMCGNAARCVGRYIMLHPKGVNARSFQIKTRSGLVRVMTPHRIKVKQDDIVPVVVEMPVARDYRPGLGVRVGSKQYLFDYINTGVPHAVVHNVPGTKRLETMIENVDKLGDIVNNIRKLTRFKHTGVNITFLSKVSKNFIHSLTFERGVAGYTMACGTGAVAAAIGALSGHPGYVRVKVPGGNLLVDLNGHRPLLSGPAQFIAKIYLARSSAR